MAEEKNISAEKISVVVPVFNEEENLPLLIPQLTTVLDNLPQSYELILVDDGSTDKSFPVLKELKQKFAQLKIVKLKRNFGQTAALACGLDYAQGEIIVTLDADLQNDPEDIPRLLEKIEEGYEVVSGWRRKRAEPLLSRRLPSILANWLISKSTGVKLHDSGCTLKAYQREVIEGIHLYGEMHRFIPALASRLGAKIGELEVKHHPRKLGKTKYGLSRTLHVFLDLLTVKFLLGYSTRPIQIFGALGIFSLFLGFISGIATIVMKIATGIDMTGNPLLYLSILLGMAGIQFISLGLLGEVNIRTYYEAQHKRTYVVEEVVGLKDREEVIDES